MVSTYVNNLRVAEPADGDSGWGTSTNTSLELIGEALGIGTEAIVTNADTHTSTVANETSSPARAFHIKYTGTLDSDCTITIEPNTMKRVQIIENATSGGFSIIISQGSGANVTIASSSSKVVYLDGAGSGAAVVDALPASGAYNAWVEVVTTHTAANGDQLICNHASTPFTVTLPLSPTKGDTVTLKNVGAALVTVGRNSEKIDGASADGTLPEGNAVQLVFTDDAAIGWTSL